jgi:hypothetical protein
MQGDDPQHDTGLSNTIKNWQVSKQYNKECIDIIEDDDKGTTESPTSIPSPFARIALAKTAFAEVAKGNTSNSYRQIVSDCLDLAEICFNWKDWQSHFDIVTWDKKEDLDALPDKNPLKSTLRLFLLSDKDEFHFDIMQKLYILTLKTGEAIGATSPCNLFFSPENNYSDIKSAPAIHLSGNLNAFQKIDPANNYFGTPLYARDWDFVEYLWNFCYSVGVDQCVIDYLVSQKTYFDSDKQVEITQIENNPSIDSYTDFLENVDIQGVRFSVRPNGGDSENIGSDLELTINKLGKGIVIIPNGGKVCFGAKTAYNLTKTQKWDEKQFGKKHYDSNFNIYERKLPNNKEYPCLYISDFLTDTIVRMPYEMTKTISLTEISTKPKVTVICCR